MNDQPDIADLNLEQEWQRTIGRMQPLPSGSVQHYLTREAGVFLIGESLDFSGLDHVHQGYEFIVPIGRAAPYLVEDRALIAREGQLFPFNPQQPHRAPEGSDCPSFLALIFRTGFMRQLAGSIPDAQELLFPEEGIDCTPVMRRLIDDYLLEMKLRQAGHVLAAEGIAIQMGIHLLRLAGNAAGARPAYPERIRGTGRKEIRSAQDFIHANLTGDFSLADLAAAVYLSPFHLCRLFKAETGQSPFEYLTTVKIERAKQLLLAGGKSITDICFECGFNNPSHFSRVFSARVGVSPSAFRRAAL